MLPKKIAFTFLILSLFSCSNKENLPEMLIFSTNYFTNYGGDYEVWVVISDENGKLIDYKKVKGDSVLNFYGQTTSELISLTGIRILDTKVDIGTSQQLYEKGSSYFIDFTKPNALRSEIIGQSHLIINNYADASGQDFSPFQISSNYNEGGPLDYGSWLTFENAYSCNLNLAADSVDFLATTYYEGYPLYQKFSMKPGDTLTLDFEQFEEMQYIKLDGIYDGFLSSSSLSFDSYSDAGFHYFSESIQRESSLSSKNVNEVLVGYLLGYNNYSFRASYDNVFVGYNHIPNQSINIADFIESFDLDGITLDSNYDIDLKFDAGHFTFECGDTSLGSTCSWTYSSRKKSPQSIELPTEILNKLNSLSLNLSLLEIKRVQLDVELTEDDKISYSYSFP